MANSKIKVIRVGAASCGMAAGAAPVLELLYKKADGIEVQEVGCLGHCYAEPMVEVITTDGESILYGNVAGTEQAVDNILNLSQEGRFTIPEGRASKELVKVLKLAGRVVPTSWEDYLALIVMQIIIKMQLQVHGIHMKETQKYIVEDQQNGQEK